VGEGRGREKSEAVAQVVSLPAARLLHTERATTVFDVYDYIVYTSMLLCNQKEEQDSQRTREKKYPKEETKEENKRKEIWTLKENKSE
jgi:hypothetical protein